MITAVDTNVLIDVILGKANAINSIEKSIYQGSLIICEIVYAELCAGAEQSKIDAFLDELEIKLVFSNKTSLALTGNIWKNYIFKNRRKGKILPDFFIAAHSLTFADRLLTRDRGFYRKFFKKLNIIEP